MPGGPLYEERIGFFCIRRGDLEPVCDIQNPKEVKESMPHGHLIVPLVDPYKF